MSTVGLNEVKSKYRNDLQVKVVIRKPGGSEHHLVGFQSKLLVKYPEETEWRELGCAKDISINMPLEDMVTVDVQLLVSDVEVEEYDADGHNKAVDEIADHFGNGNSVPESDVEEVAL